MHRGNRSVRTSVHSLFRRTRAAQNVAPEGIRTRQETDKQTDKQTKLQNDESYRPPLPEASKDKDV